MDLELELAKSELEKKYIQIASRFVKDSIKANKKLSLFELSKNMKEVLLGADELLVEMFVDIEKSKKSLYEIDLNKMYENKIKKSCVEKYKIFEYGRGVESEVYQKSTKSKDAIDEIFEKFVGNAKLIKEHYDEKKDDSSLPFCTSKKYQEKIFKYQSKCNSYLEQFNFHMRIECLTPYSTKPNEITFQAFVCDSFGHKIYALSGEECKGSDFGLHLMDVLKNVYNVFGLEKESNDLPLHIVHA